MSEPRSVLEKLAMVIVGFLVVVIGLTYGGYFYKELRYKNRQAESARQYAEVRDKAQREVEAMTIDQAIDAVPTALDYRWEFLEGRLMRDRALWHPTNEAEQARLRRAITALGGARYANLGGVVDQILTVDVPLQPALRDALIAGLATEKSVGPRSDVATMLFEKAGSSWLTPAIPALQLTPDVQARIVRELLERHTPQGRALVLAWIKGGLVTTTAEYPRSLVDELKRGWSDWEQDAKPDDRAFATELEAAEKAAAKPAKTEKKP